MLTLQQKAIVFRSTLATIHALLRSTSRCASRLMDSYVSESWAIRIFISITIDINRNAKNKIVAYHLQREFH